MMASDNQFSELVNEILSQCDQLAACTGHTGIIHRTFLSQPMLRAHALVEQWMQDAGMTVRKDAMGNIIGRKSSSRKNAPVLLMGSHLDTVPDAGKYDGILGVIMGIALAKLMAERDYPFHFDVIGFSDEEGVRFKMSYLGSLAVAGLFDLKNLEKTDSNGISMAGAIKNFGLNPEEVKQAAYDFSKVAGFVEFHIEQGPVLESENLPLGIVTGLVGQTRGRFTFRGLAAHAGTVPMNLRQDAFMGLSELAMFMEDLTRKNEGLLATVGMVNVKPGGSNVIPGEVYFSIDVRDIDQAVLDRATSEIIAAAQKIANRRNLEMVTENLEHQAVVTCNEPLMQNLQSAVEANGFPVRRLVSGAGHDLAILSKVTPSAMLFLRSPGGISHNPIESVLPQDVEAALKVGLTFLNNFALTP